MQLPLPAKTHNKPASTTASDHTPNTIGKLSTLNLHLTYSNQINKIIHILGVPYQRIPLRKQSHTTNTNNHINHNNPNHNHKSSSLLYKAQLHAQKGDKSITLKNHQNFSICGMSQMANRDKAVHEAIMKNPVDTNMADIEDTMVFTTRIYVT